MDEIARNARNRERLTELYPDFAARLSRVIEELQELGFRPRIQDAWRSEEDQMRAFQSGHSKLKYGFHNVTSKDGKREALAVDLLDDSSPLEPPSSYIIRLAAVAEKHGLTTGVRWGLPKRLADAVDAAISSGRWDAPVKVGCDPVHVESTGVTIAEARAGKRPS